MYYCLERIAWSKELLAIASFSNPFVWLSYREDNSRLNLLTSRFTHRAWRRSRFYILLAVLMLGLSLLVAHRPSVARSTNLASEIRGVWITTNDTDVVRDQAKLQAAVAKLGTLNFNTLYPVVWNSGYVLYPSAIAQRHNIQPFVRRGLQGQDILADLVAQAHQQRLLVVPWFEFGFMAPPSSELTTHHPTWLTQRRDGSKNWSGAAGEVVWLNPFHPEVQEFMTDLVLEVVTQYEVDGIQFDDHMSLPNEFGYDPYTVSLYRQEMQQDPPANPQDPAWVKWRADRLTDFMTRLHAAVKQRRPDAIFSVAPNPYITAYNTFMQDWLTWVRQGIVDELIVQIYRPDLYSFVEQINRPEIQEARQVIPTGAGILTGLRNRPVAMPLIRTKIQEARDRGLGFSFFFYESLWEVAPEPAPERQANFQALFRMPAVRGAAQSAAFHR